MADLKCIELLKEVINLTSMRVIGSPLYQWETGRQVQLFPLWGTKIDTIHFSNLGDTEALCVIPQIAEGMVIADIPNILLQSGRKIVAHSVSMSEDCFETIWESILAVHPRPKPSDYVYTETEVLEYRTLSKRIDEIEKNGVSDEQIATAVEKYLDENPVNAGVQFETDTTLTLKDGILSVNTTNEMEQDNTLPITSAGVFAQVGNIEAILKTI